MVTALLEDGVLCAPTVGVWYPTSEAILLAEPGACIGRIWQAGQWINVVAPEKVPGLLKGVTDGGVWCERGAVLFEVLDTDGHIVAAEEQEDSEAGLPPDAFVVRSDTDGTIYLRPSPEAPLYVSVGDVVAEKQTLALVEVMKTFSPVRSDKRVEILAVRVADGASVTAGDVLFWVRDNGA